MWINAFLANNGVSNKFFTRALVTRTNLFWMNHFQLLCGNYCGVQNEPEPSNTMMTITRAAIAVGLTGSFQGSQNNWSLKTRNILKRRTFT